MARPDYVRIVNRGERLWRDKHENREYRLQPGEEMIVPWTAMVRWLGDPDAFDGAGPKQRDRAGWRQRLNAKYGMADAPFYNDEPRDATHTEWEEAVPYVPDGPRYRHPNLPRLEVWDGQTRVVTVVDDPDGNNHTPAGLVTPTETAAEQVASLERQIAALRAQMNLAEGPRPAAPPADLPAVEEDGPSRRRAKAHVG